MLTLVFNVNISRVDADARRMPHTEFSWPCSLDRISSSWLISRFLRQGKSKVIFSISSNPARSTSENMSLVNWLQGLENKTGITSLMTKLFRQWRPFLNLMSPFVDTSMQSSFTLDSKFWLPASSAKPTSRQLSRWKFVRLLAMQSRQSSSTLIWQKMISKFLSLGSWWTSSRFSRGS